MVLIFKNYSIIMIWTICCMCCPIEINAQGTISDNSDYHIKFMGLPINGSIDSFTASLEKKGFIKTSYGESSPHGFSGPFSMFKSVGVDIYFEPRLDNQVYEVHVYIHNTTEDQINDLWDRLKEKYGNEGVYIAQDINTAEYFIFFPKKKELSANWDDKSTIGDYISLKEVKKSKTYKLTYCNRANYFEHIAAENEEL